jgi:hypothetical protein
MHVAAHQYDSSTGEAVGVAKRQALFREVNEQMGRVSAADLPSIAIICECASAACQERIELTPEEYEQVRRVSTRFAVLPGHEQPPFERVVETHERFLIVEATGDAAVAATRLDPRRRR